MNIGLIAVNTAETIRSTTTAKAVVETVASSSEKRLNPYELVQSAAASALKELVGDNDITVPMYMAFGSYKAERFRNQVNYYILLKNGYSINESNNYILDEDKGEKLYDPSYDIARDFYNHYKYSDNTNISNFPGHEQLQALLKKAIDSKIEEYKATFSNRK